MSRPSFRIAIGNHGNTLALKNGAIASRDFDLNFIEVDPLVQVFRRMVRGSEFDIAEMAITTYLAARAHGKPFTALPIFLVRAFHHGAILRNIKSSVLAPKDLDGRIVGVNRGYTVTTGVWARSILAEQYGVNLYSVTWLLSGDEHVQEFRPPANTMPVGEGKTLAEMLAYGEIPAAIGVECTHDDVRPLIPNGTEVGLTALREHGHYPINHVLVVRNELLEAYPELGTQLMDLFTLAKNDYVERLATSRIAHPTKADILYREVMNVIPDPIPYGLPANLRVLNQLARSALAQGIVNVPVRIEDAFGGRPTNASARLAG